MDSYIASHYNIIETYEKNKYQEIQMGTKTNDPEDIVVINQLLKSPNYDPNLKDQLESSLKNLLYITEDDSKIIIATEYHEGISLNDYLKSSKISQENREKIAKDYLSSIQRYQGIDHQLLKVLVDAKQVNINDNALVLNELILLSSDESIDFSMVTKTIGHSLKMILDSDPFIESLLEGSSVYTSIDDIIEVFNNHYETPKTEVEAFNYNNYFDDVNKDTDHANGDKMSVAAVGLTDIDLDEDKEPIPEMPSETQENLEPDETQENLDELSQEEIELSSLGFIEDEEDLIEENKDEKDNTRKFIIPIAILALLLFGFLISRLDFFKDSEPVTEYTVSYTKETTEKGVRFTADVEDPTLYTFEWKFYDEEEELATFDKPSVLIDFTNEGNYRITLRVQNEDGIWSDLYEEEYVHKEEDMSPIDDESSEDQATEIGESSESYDDYTIKYQSDNIIDDYENKKSGDKSLKFDFDGEEKQGKIRLEGILLKGEATISFYIKSSTREPIEIGYEGFVGNTSKFDMTKNYVPKVENTWFMYPVTVNTSSVDDLVLTFKTSEGTIWIDDIEIENYK